MLSDRVAPLIARARGQLGLSQKELAERVGTSLRTIGELERGKRPKVALETALKIMELLGISVVFRAPDGSTAEVRPKNAAAVERAARAAARRSTWVGGTVPFRVSEPPESSGSPATRLRALSQVTRSAYAVADAGARSARGSDGGERRSGGR